MSDIVRIIGEDAAILQLAEECGELSQACSKMVRKRVFPQNPTPKTVEECEAAMNEEVADVLFCIEELVKAGIIDSEVVDEWYKKKQDRWLTRISEVAENGKG